MATIQTDLPNAAASSQHNTCTFDDSDTRADDMRDQLDAWVEDLAELTDEAQASEQFQQWLEVQSKLQISRQNPHSEPRRVDLSTD
ncbi:hypothetical protein [Haloarcula amylovorans]|uniref:hypothetical protein n=1 Tax=Haloarcula amylovorans TaxID=2562280 RepID=UPI001FD76EB0|nr:hypothetical protein [Halomicroarcula amylolytica]